MDDVRLFPPLRLVLNTSCNGNCYFCHHEGCDAKNQEMSWEIIRECIEAAKQLRIPKISLTGGEPTLREDLCDIISEIKCQYPSVELGITTNGFALSQISDDTMNLLDKINLSIISFEKKVYKKYQGINPVVIFDFLRKYTEKTTINIVVVDDNKDEIVSLVESCFQYGFSVDLMFELVSNDILLQKKILSILTQKYGLFYVHYGSTPVMIQYEHNNKKLRIKAPSISKIICRNLCRNCPKYNSCPEKVCALRIHPTGSVSPCLNEYMRSNRHSVFEQIMDLYPLLGVDTENLYDFFLR